MLVLHCHCKSRERRGKLVRLYRFDLTACVTATYTFHRFIRDGLRHFVPPLILPTLTLHCHCESRERRGNLIRLYRFDLAIATLDSIRMHKRYLFKASLNHFPTTSINYGQYKKHPRS